MHDDEGYGNDNAADGLDLRPPKTVGALGLPPGLIDDLVLRQALVEGRTSTLRLSEKLALSPLLVTTIVEHLRELRYLEVQGLEGRDYLLALTEAGRQNANDRLQLCRYTGPAPVNLDEYSAMVRRQHASPKIDLETISNAFSDLVISEDLLCELGPAAIAGGAMFLYGPPGTGKSSIAERLLRIHHDHVLVPHAVEVDGQVISVYDPVVHRAVPDQPHEIDRRWVLCERPCIIVGGELVGSMLDLAYQADSGVYLAPLQMQANNGILVIDDFGRQTLTPEQLLNRWIVPLDRQIDYLSLDYGMKFQVPFDAKIVFSTNFNPEVLGDEAFYRRIQSKILIPTIDDDQFDEVLRRVAKAMDVRVVAGAAEHLRWVSRNEGDGDLRPYLPAAMLKILLSICEFASLPPVLDEAMIDRIARLYFTNANRTKGEIKKAKKAKKNRQKTRQAPRSTMASILEEQFPHRDADTMDPWPAEALFAPADEVTVVAEPEEPTELDLAVARALDLASTTDPAPTPATPADPPTEIVMVNASFEQYIPVAPPPVSAPIATEAATAVATAAEGTVDGWPADPFDGVVEVPYRQHAVSA